MKTFTEVRARRNDQSDLYHQSYTNAIDTALKGAEKDGYKLDKEEVAQEIGLGRGKPGRGKTVRHTIALYKGDKKQRKALHIQVYNRDTAQNPYELNWYIS